jgi:hypothetical protein
MKVALFRSMSTDNVMAWNSPEYLSEDKRDAYCPSDFVRISEWVDVEFPALASDEVIQAQLQQIDKAEQAVRERFHEELERFRGMRANLMALPAPAEAA